MLQSLMGQAQGQGMGADNIPVKPMPPAMPRPQQGMSGAVPMVPQSSDEPVEEPVENDGE